MVLVSSDVDKKYSTHELAERLKASEAHLSKVMRQLVKAELVCSVTGPGGGFELAKNPELITLLDIFEVIEGPLTDCSCLVGEPICGRMNCILGDMLSLVNKSVRGYLKNTDLAMLQEGCELKGKKKSKKQKKQRVKREYIKVTANGHE
jgi:Rrf2 family protein